MSTRQTVVVSTRTTRAERALIRAMAEQESLSVCEAVHRLLIPAVKERLASAMAESP
jgi:hypothetical protein